MFLLFAVPSVVIGMARQDNPWLAAVLAIAFLGYGTGCVVALALMWGWSLTRRLLMLAGLLVLATVVVLLLGPDSTWLYVYAVSVAALALPSAVELAVLLCVLTGAGVLLSAGRGLDSLATDWIVLLAVAVATWLMGRLIRANYQLAAAQDEIALLATGEERARLAAELQERLGQVLAAITERAGLAAAEVRGGTDRAAAIEQVRAVEDLARQAVTEVRAAVSGYRTASLAAELVGARAALEAAGIAVTLPASVDAVAPAYREAFAHVLRDGVTSLLSREHGATRCEVRLGQSWLEVCDDGTATVPEVNSQVAERIAGIGGQIAVGPVAGGGFLLRVAVAS
ncbi:hypothetical protein GCM10010174_56430 [Kutzneria viridogrisea]